MALENNPLILKSNLKYGAIPFDEIKLEHFMPALEYAINEAEKVTIRNKIKVKILFLNMLIIYISKNE